MTTDSQGPRRSSGIRLPLWALGILLVLGVLLLAASSVWLFRTVRDIAASPGLVEAPEFDAAADSNGSTVQAPIVTAEGGVEAPVVANPEPIAPWSGTERINLLFMGVDLRCDEEGPTHSDTLMVVSLDPVSRSAGILSLPRDLWVPIPGYGSNRINQAYFNGQAYDLPGGGAQLAADTVEGFLGIPIDYYLTVDFQAFVEVVDLLGGIMINAPEAINDPTYPDACYGYDPFNLPAGQYRMDGQTALKYARTRATLGGDVDRAARQQEVVLALRNQATQLDNLPQLIVSAPQLWRSFQDNVNTNLSLEQMLQLGQLARELPPENIRNVVIDYNYVEPSTTPDGQQVLIPIMSSIRQLRDDLFAPPAVPTPQIEANPERIEDEGARVAIYNGTATFGLASTTQDLLRQEGVNVTEIGNADSSTYSATQIIDYGSHPGTVRFLVQRMGIPPLNASTGVNPAGDYDVLVILGQDWNDKLNPTQ